MTLHATSTPTAVAPGRVGRRLLVGALGFLGGYLAVSLLPPALASSAAPLPDEPAARMQAWLVDNQAAAAATALCQLVSVAFLAYFVVSHRRAVVAAEQRAAYARAVPWGLAAVAAMVVSCAVSLLAAATASSVSTDTVGVLRTAGFVAGGTAHVAALGVFVWLASRVPGTGRGIRRLAWFAAVPAVASLVSLVVFEGAVLILLGRVLCMVWAVSAAVGVHRRLTRARS